MDGTNFDRLVRSVMTGADRRMTPPRHRSWGAGWLVNRLEWKRSCRGEHLQTARTQVSAQERLLLRPLQKREVQVYCGDNQNWRQHLPGDRRLSGDRGFLRHRLRLRRQRECHPMLLLR